MFGNPASRFFRDGLRCLQRYPRMWIWLSVLGLSYAVFQVVQAYQLGEREFSLRALLSWPVYKPHQWAESARKAWLPALELLAGLFNQAVVSYPASAFAALLFLGNWRGYQMHFLHSARRRLGRWWPAIYLCLVLCALAACCKPLFSISIYWLNQYLDGIFLLRLGAIIDWLSFQFEYLFGLLIQIFLVLLTFVWIRGLNSQPERIFEFALKRAVFAAKWAGVILLATLVLIHLPLLISYFWITQQTDFTRAVIEYIEQTARPLIAVALILFCSVQITLTLHNEMLREAVREHAQFVRRHWFRILWFLVVAGLHFYAISWLNDFILGAFPPYSAPNLLLSGLFTIARAFLAAWFLASWVCLYRAAQTLPKEIQF
ncbi:MAG: hypothetical protein JO279_08000 [Verrucomicrobia bacterium]|nr:hypothetical protein [Verrucomicrobiota bacterium]